MAMTNPNIPTLQDRDFEKTSDSILSINDLEKKILLIGALFEISFKKTEKQIEILSNETENYVDHATYQEVFDYLCGMNIDVSKAKAQFSNSLKYFHGISNVDESAILNFNTDDLSLVTDKELEYQLKLESSFQQAKERLDRIIIESKWRFKDNASHPKIANILECIRPSNLGVILQGVLKTTAPKIARISYRFMGYHLFSNLLEIYDLIERPLKMVALDVRKNNKELASTLDHIPTLGEDKHTSQNDNNSDSVDSNARGVTNVDVTGLIKNWDVPASLNNNQSFSGFSDITLDDITPDTEIRTLSSEEIAKLLSSLTEKNRLDTNTVLDVSDVRHALKESLSKMSHDGILSVIDKVSENILNLVSHLFENVNVDSQLIPAVAYQVSRLQSPVMQIALTDTKLFQSNGHPVRKLLNNLGGLGVRITSEDEEGFIKLNSIVDGLLGDFEGESQTFEQYSIDTEDYLNHSVYSIKNSEDGLDFATLPEGNRFPSIIEFLDAQQNLLSKELSFHKLIRHIWSAILAKEIKTNGSYSESWIKATKIYSAVLWSTQADASEEGKRSVLRKIPKIVGNIRDIFSHYGLKESLRNELLEQMLKIHIKIVKGTSGVDIEDDTDNNYEIFQCLNGSVFDEVDNNKIDDGLIVDLVHIEEKDCSSNVFLRFDAISHFDDKEEIGKGQQIDPDADGPTEELCRELSSDETSLRETFEEITSLPLETIFEFSENGIKKRFRLTGKSVRMGTFTFQSFENRKIFEMTKAQLAVAILRETCRRIEHKSLFDNALESVATEIQTQNKM